MSGLHFNPETFKLAERLGDSDTLEDNQYGAICDHVLDRLEEMLEPLSVNELGKILNKHGPQEEWQQIGRYTAMMAIRGWMIEAVAQGVAEALIEVPEERKRAFARAGARHEERFGERPETDPETGEVRFAVPSGPAAA